MIKISGYKLSEIIYKGWNSIVYRAKDIENNKNVIIKVFSKEKATGDDIARFRREFAITASFDYNGIIKVFKLENINNTLGIIMEDFNGISLEEILEKRKISPKELLELSISIANSLGHIHENQIIHKDVNLSNILWNDTTKQVKIIDFGISTELSRENLEIKNLNVLEGSLHYISPEQTGRMNKTLDYRTDFYSLGVTFYKLITGKLPFESNDTMELVHSHIAIEPTPIINIEHNNWTNKNEKTAYSMLSQIINKLMSKTPEKRYQSSFGLVHDLEECLKLVNHQSEIQKHFIPGAKDITERFQIPQKLYGRDTEIESLMNAFNRIKVGGKELLLVSGRSGIGKSALINEIHKPVIEKRGYFIKGKFDQFKRDIPYSAFGIAISKLIEQILVSDNSVISYWKERILNKLGINGQIIIDMVPELQLLIGNQPPLKKLGLDETRNRFVLTVQNFVRALGDPKHPVVIFLDDLQWADLASLKLIELTISDVNVKGLLIIGAYRDNEINEIHPLTDTIEEIKKENKRLKELGLINQELITNILIEPLNFDNVLELTSETLYREKDEIQQFAGLCYKKTNGNPFFLNQLLLELYRNSIVNFNYKSGCWIWNEKMLTTYRITDNVVELMEDKIKTLSNKSQNLIKLAACAGNSFNLNTLAIISNMSARETATDLWKILKTGLIEPKDENYKYIDIGNSNDNLEFNPKYAFIHDRVQQAGYSMISDNEKQKIHVSIARLMLNELDISDNFEIDKISKIDDEIFEIINHFNKGISVINDPHEKNIILKLNLKAGKKAMTSNAYRPALNYFKTCFKLLEENYWSENYSFTMSLYVNALEAAYYNFDFELIDKLSSTILDNTRTIFDEVPVYEILMKSFSAQHKLDQVVLTGSEILKKLGLTLPHKPSKLHLLKEFFKTKKILKGKSIDDLYNLPLISNKEALAKCDVLGTMLTSAYFARPDLAPLLSLKLMQLAIQFGNYPKSHIYPFYGAMSLAISKDYETCYQFGELGLRLSQKEEFRESRARNILMFYTMNHHWKKPLRESVEALHEGFQAALEVGDLEYACLCLHVPGYHGIHAGLELSEHAKQMDHHREQMIHLKNKTILKIFGLSRQAAASLMGETDNPYIISGKFFREETDIELCKKANAKTTIGAFYQWKIILGYLFAKYDLALENDNNIQEYKKAMLGLAHMPMNYLYSSLTRLALYETATVKERKKYLKVVLKNQKTLKTWAKHSPNNHLHKWHLVEAELAKTRDQFKDAIHHYEAAIELARGNMCSLEEAQACELYAKFWEKNGNSKFEQLYILEAHSTFEKWGAKAKSKQLETLYPDYLLKAERSNIGTINIPNTTLIDTNIASTNILDLFSSQKAFQTISNEINLNKLLTKIMAVVIENAGAEKGALILPKEKIWNIEVIGNTKTKENKLVNSIPLFINANDKIEGIENEENSLISKNIVKYVINTNDTIILDNAWKSGNFSNDKYISNNKVKSVLCIPLLNQSELIAVLYLENNLANSVFTPDRIQVLKLLSSQAAISIKNATLYSKLRKSENKFRSIFENAGVGIFQTTLSGKLLTVNQAGASLLKYNSPLEAINLIENMSENLYVDSFRREEFVQLVQENGIVKNFEFECWRKDKSIITASINAHLVKDEKGEIKYLEGIFEDITKKKLADKYKIDKEVAEASTKAKSDFLANMSHEIRTPMNAVIGLSELALKAEIKPKQKDYLKKINNSAQGLLRIINEILDYSKIEAGKMSIENVPFTFNEIMETIEFSIGLTASKKNIDLVFDISDEIPDYLIGDPVRLGQILINLAGNAVKFTDKGKITISSEIIENNNESIKLLFSVKDTGIGMKEEQLQKLFRSFQQADTTISRKYGGTGLGLAISKQLVNMMNGTINVESEFGKGSLFTFELSFGITTEIETLNFYKNESPLHELNQIKGASILLAEDNPINQQISKEFIENMGLNVEIAENGLAAVESVKKKTFDLVLMDIQLPELDGLEATKLIRKLGFTKLPIIAMTAHALSEDRERSLEAGMNAHLTKPIEADKLRETLIKWLPKIKIEDSILQKGKLNIDVPENKNFELPEIDVLDIKQGLKNSGGVKKRYHNLLREFTKLYINTPTTLENFINQNDIRLAKKEVHSFRGAAQQLGANILGDKAFALESILNSDYSNESNETFLAFKEAHNMLFLKLVDFYSLNSFYHKKVTDITENNLENNLSIFKEEINILLEFLETGNSRAEKIANDIFTKINNSSLKENFKYIILDIENVEFNNAIKRIHKIKHD